MAAYWPASPIRSRSRAAARTTSSPATRAVPASGCRSVARTRTAVVLPAPLGPSSPSTVPGAASKSTPASARTVLNDFTRPRTLIAGSLPRAAPRLSATAEVMPLLVSTCGHGTSYLGQLLSAKAGNLPYPMTETSGRLLKLLSLLQRRDWPGEELARRLEVSARTIRRDVERLREPGYPVDALTGPRAAIGWRPGRRCRRCSSTTTRPWRSRSACGRPRARRSASRRPPCARSSSSSRCSLAPAPASTPCSR